MSKERLKNLETHLISAVEGQMENLKQVDTKELGEVIDMIKDLSESVYYCTITESMEKVENEQKKVNYYTTPVSAPYRDMERDMGYMYYPTSSTSTTNMGSSNNSGHAYFTEIRDPREGTAAYRRKLYMEGKQKHKDSTSQLHELEIYLQELSNDIVEMIDGASSEEKNTLRQKITALANKI